MSKDRIKDYGILFAIELAGLLVLALSVRHHFSNTPPHTAHQRPIFVAYIPIALGILFSIGNIHIMWLRPLLYRLRMGSLDGFHQESGLPMISGWCLVLGSLLAPPSIYTGIVIVFFALLNPVGMHWVFLSALWLWRTDQK